jgi:CRISPR/Cas system-associated exonuclease Cas4 (RecB family)
MTGSPRLKGSDDINRRYEKGLAQLHGYIEYQRTCPEKPLMLDEETPVIEWEFSLDLDGLEIRGFIDKVIEWPTGQVGPEDLKTGTKKPDWPLQLGVYKLAIEQDFGVTVEWGQWYMAKNNAPDSPINLSRFTREYVTELFHGLDKGITSGVFLPSPGDACRTCGVSKFCSAIGNPSLLPEVAQ